VLLEELETMVRKTAIPNWQNLCLKTCSSNPTTTPKDFAENKMNSSKFKTQNKMKMGTINLLNIFRIK